MATFHVGLTMAGAISAGAYRAGVFDFLVEALEAWEKRKAELRAEGRPLEEWDVPSHDVVIPVMSGASAGGITGALGLVALADAAAEPMHDVVPEVGTVTATLPRLYNAWVSMPRFVSPAGSDLLGDKDLQALEKGKSVSSLLDTTLLTEIVDKSLRGIDTLQAPRPYLAAGLHLYLTHTNVRGVPYAVRFLNDQGLEQGYDMMCHADRVHYVVDGIGADTSFGSKWADPEPSRRISTSTLPGLNGQRALTEEWLNYAMAAVGSGAFPAGLSARLIQPMTVDDYTRRRWPLRHSSLGGGNFVLEPSFPPVLASDQASRVDYVTVDGGVINNEPFELARWTLMENPPEGNPRDPLEAKRAVIMIDPFPEAPDYDSTGDFDASLTAVIKSMMPTLKNQARFKPADAADALDETVYSRFLVAPRRKRHRDAKNLEMHAIACGLLGGFGGFLAKSFRAHDYQLGRLNAYLFLKDSFALPLSKGQRRQSVLEAGYGTAARVAKYRTKSADKQYPGDFYQIIPVLPGQPAAPVWPRVDGDTVKRMVERAIERADKVFANLRDNQSSRLIRWGASLGWKWLGRDRVAEFIHWTVKRDLIRRDQILGPSADQPDAVRRTMAALADPAYDLRTVGGIASKTGLTHEQVDTSLQVLRKLGVIWEGPRTEGGSQSFTLAERKPSGWKIWWGLRNASEWLNGPPAID